MMMDVTAEQIAEWDAELAALTGSLGYLFNWSFPSELDSLILGRRSRRKQFQVGSKKSSTSKRYTAEFKRDAIALVHSSGKTVTKVAREIGVSPEGLRNWVNQDKTDQGQGSAGALTSDEKEELRRLRRENREQQQTIEILNLRRPSS